MQLVFDIFLHMNSVSFVMKYVAHHPGGVPTKCPHQNSPQTEMGHLCGDLFVGQSVGEPTGHDILSVGSDNKLHGLLYKAIFTLTCAKSWLSGQCLAVSKGQWDIYRMRMSWMAELLKSTSDFWCTLVLSSLLVGNGLLLEPFLPQQQTTTLTTNYRKIRKFLQWLSAFSLHATLLIPYW